MDGILSCARINVGFNSNCQRQTSERRRNYTSLTRSNSCRFDPLPLQIYMYQHELDFKLRFFFFLAPCSLKTLKETTIDYWHDVYGYNMAPLAIESLKR